MVGDGDLVGRGKSAPSRIRGQPTPEEGSPTTCVECARESPMWVRGWHRCG